MANEGLTSAKKAKNDEFYTQYADIEKEMNAYLEYDPDVFRGKTILLPCDDPEWSNFTKYFAQNFDKFRLKKLISTSYAPNSKPKEIPYQPTLFEIESPDFDESKTESNGKIFTLTKDNSGDKVINFEDLEWSYLEGDGDFRSDEVTKLRDEADFIITNPPFSLFREFLEWIVASRKKLALIGNMNAITYKEVFPLIRENFLWLGATSFNEGMFFEVPESWNYSDSYKFEREIDGKKVSRVPGVCWFTNIEHGKRHAPIPLMSMADNIKFSKHQEIRVSGYRTYDNFAAIEVPFTSAIPSDYDGVMGVPITFLDKYAPEQFEILGTSQSWDSASGLRIKTYPKQLQVASAGVEKEVSKLNDAPAIEIHSQPSGTHYKVGGRIYEATYKRLLIRHRRKDS